MKHIFLDSYPLGLAAAPTHNVQAAAVKQWTRDCLAAGHEVYIPEVSACFTLPKPKPSWKI